MLERSDDGWLDDEAEARYPGSIDGLRSDRVLWWCLGVVVLALAGGEDDWPPDEGGWSDRVRRWVRLRLLRVLRLLRTRRLPLLSEDCEFPILRC